MNLTGIFPSAKGSKKEVFMAASAYQCWLPSFSRGSRFSQWGLANPTSLPCIPLLGRQGRVLGPLPDSTLTDCVMVVELSDLTSLSLSVLIYKMG